MIRAILLIDMDAFFASVEQARRPELAGLPVVVGGRAESRGVVSTCSYEARACGVHTAMPMAQALRVCPQAAFLPVDMQAYVAVHGSCSRSSGASPTWSSRCRSTRRSST